MKNSFDYDEDDPITPEEVERYNKIISGVLWILIFLCLLWLVGMVAGCKNVITQQTKYYNDGRISEQFYSTDTSFKFFSEGSGKTIEISPSVNGVGLGL